MDEQYDLILVYNPQPLAVRQFRGTAGARWLWRCHIDTSEPNPQVWRFVRTYLEGYDGAVFTLGSFAPPNFPLDRVEIIPPAIDPESPKNFETGDEVARRVLQWIGIELDRPLVTRVSRSDPWKDPLGVIAVYQRARQELPALELTLVGAMALDDPAGWEMYRLIQDAARDDPSIHLFTNLTGVSNIEVNAFQRLSNVKIQKSLREGFGLVVSETLWKGTPVVARHAGGIPLHLQDNAGGFLVESTEECAERLLWLLRHPAEEKGLAARGRERVRQHFLPTRLLADELCLYSALLDGPPGAELAASAEGDGEAPDAVYGTRLSLP